MTSSMILWSVVFGSIGFAYFMYGKKQRKVVPLISGLVLCIYPYFMPNSLILVIVGIALLATPYFIKR
ncbi:hypothetical protein [Algibacillus agarilyticus]|uniref:hypothetical protein n=1 Tax=Algibacillus agarilyticus TaxID=2234133 RepID=UPI003F6A2A70